MGLYLMFCYLDSIRVGKQLSDCLGKGFFILLIKNSADDFISTAYATSKEFEEE